MSLVQCVANDNGAGANTLTVTLASTSAGNLVGCAFFYFGTISTVQDNLGQNYTVGIAPVTEGGGSNQASLYYFPNSAAGVTLITVTFTGSTPGTIFGFEESGIATASPVDSTPVGQGQSTTAWTSTAMAATSNANDVLYGFAGGGTSDADTCTAGTNWTAVTGTGITGGTRGNTVDHSIGFLERQEVTATGAYDASGTWGGAQKTASLVVAFKKTSGDIAPSLGMILGNYSHPGQSPGQGNSSSRFTASSWWPYPAPSTYVVAPTEGAVTIDGYATSLTLTIAAIAGAIVIAGNAPNITTTIAPSVGAVVISGNTSSITTTIAASTGAVVIGGNAPALTSTLTPSEASVVIGGNVPDIPGLPITPTESAIIIGGNAPDVSTSAPLAVTQFSGGYEYARRSRKRLEEELRRERENWGILPKAAQIIAAVAIRQADELEVDASQRLAELERELDLAGVQYQARYLEVLNLQRQRLIDAEIKGFFEAQEVLDEENKRRLLLLLAFL